MPCSFSEKMKKLSKFVIQKHTKQNQPAHWDLMLQSKNCLETFRLEFPPDKLKQKNTAVKIADHPLKFLTYEGSVNNGLGIVKIADSGTYDLLNETEGLKEFQLNGNILSGLFVLTHIESDHWEFIRSGA